MPKLTATLPLAAALLLAGCNVSFSTGDDSSANDSSEAATAPAAEPAAADKAAAEAAVREVYAPYLATDGSSPAAAWDRPIFSREMAALVATIPHPEGEIGPMDDVDWFCGCQDWDSATARIASLATSAGTDGKLLVASSFLPMAEAEPTNITFVMVKEDGKWLVDDMLSTGTDRSLRGDIAEAVSQPAGT